MEQDEAVADRREDGTGTRMNSLRLYLAHLVFAVLPPTRFFSIKASLLRWAGASVGTGVRVVSSARFHVSGSLWVGDRTWIGEDVRVLGGDAPVTIGADVDIGPRVTLVTGTHALWGGSQGKAAGPGYSEPIEIGDGVWLGACSTILAGVRVGRSSMVAAGAVVTAPVRDFTVVAGVPARVVREHEAAVCREH